MAAQMAVFTGWAIPLARRRVVVPSGVAHHDPEADEQQHVGEELHSRSDAIPRSW